MMITTNKIKEENADLISMLNYNREVIDHVDRMLNSILADAVNDDFDEQNVEYYKNVITFVTRRISSYNYKKV